MIARNNQIRSEGSSLPNLRETFRHKLRYAVDMVGSVKRASELIGVNRTQFNRYLSGQSMPRPELLYQFCQRLSLPMEWFFDPGEDYGATLSEHALGSQMHQMIAGRRFRISQETMPDGFYLLWKGMFAATWTYEAVLGLLNTRNGVRTLKISAIRSLKISGAIRDANRSDFNIELAVFSSANSIFMMSMAGKHNHVRTFVIRSRTPTFGRRASIVFSGVGLSGAFGGLAKNTLVPIVLEKLPSESTSDVLRAARTVGAYEPDELPKQIKEALDDVNVPSFSLN